MSSGLPKSEGATWIETSRNVDVSNIRTFTHNVSAETLRNRYRTRFLEPGRSADSIVNDRTEGSSVRFCGETLPDGIDSSPVEQWASGAFGFSALRQHATRQSASNASGL